MTILNNHIKSYLTENREGATAIIAIKKTLPIANTQGYMKPLDKIFKKSKNVQIPASREYWDMFKDSHIVILNEIGQKLKSILLHKKAEYMFLNVQETTTTFTKLMSLWWEIAFTFPLLVSISTMTDGGRL